MHSPSNNNPVPLSLPSARTTVTSEDLSGMARDALRYLNHLLCDRGGIGGLHCMRTQERLHKAIEGQWIQLFDNAIHLNPVAILPDTLMHRGRDTQRSRDAMRRFDVFGNPSGDYPTYLSTREMKCEADAWSDWSWGTPFTSDQKLLLEVSSEELQRTRLVYIDPESLRYTEGIGGGADQLGEMFIVLGGIPRSALVRLTRPWVSTENLSKRWPD